MPVEDVLDDGEAESRAATFATAFNVDPIEAFGKARDRFARNAFAFILDRDKNLSGATTFASGGGAPEAHAHLALVAAVFDRVVNEVLKHLGQFVLVTDDEMRLRRPDRHCDAIGLSNRTQNQGGIPNDGDDTENPGGRIVLVELNARQRQ